MDWVDVRLNRDGRDIAVIVRCLVVKFGGAGPRSIVDTLMMDLALAMSWHRSYTSEMSCTACPTHS